MWEIADDEVDNHAHCQLANAQWYIEFEVMEGFFVVVQRTKQKLWREIYTVFSIVQQHYMLISSCMLDNRTRPHNDVASSRWDKLVFFLLNTLERHGSVIQQHYMLICLVFVIEWGNYTVIWVVFLRARWVMIKASNNVAQWRWEKLKHDVCFAVKGFKEGKWLVERKNRCIFEIGSNTQTSLQQPWASGGALQVS